MWQVIASLVEPIIGLVREAVPDKDRQAEIHARIVQLETELAQRLLEYEQRLLDAQRQTIVAEAQGHSWLQRSWRPITMLTMLALVVLDALGLLAHPLPSQAWTLIQIGVGGYVAGRSAEKIAAIIRSKGG